MSEQHCMCVGWLGEGEGVKQLLHHELTSRLTSCKTCLHCMTCITSDMHGNVVATCCMFLVLQWNETYTGFPRVSCVLQAALRLWSFGLPA